MALLIFLLEAAGLYALYKAGRRFWLWANEEEIKDELMLQKEKTEVYSSLADKVKVDESKRSTYETLFKERKQSDGKFQQ